MRLARALRALGHDVEYVAGGEFAGKPDPDIRAVARALNRVLITQDIRFADMREFIPGTHPGIVLVRLRRAGRLEVNARVRSVFETEDVESWRGCFVVIDR